MSHRPVSLIISILSLDPLEIPDSHVVAALSPAHWIVVLLGGLAKYK